MLPSSIYQRQQLNAADFDGAAGSGLFDFSASYRNLPVSARICLDGVYWDHLAGDAFAWLQLFWRHPGNFHLIWIASATASETITPDGLLHAARFSLGNVPRLPDGDFYNLAVFTSGVTAGRNAVTVSGVCSVGLL